MIERKVYQCEHCKPYRHKPKIYFNKSDAYIHESACYYNLENKTCFTCRHNQRFNGQNICELHLKNDMENNVYYENKPNHFIGGKSTYYGNKDGVNLPVSLQIISNCEHWKSQGFDESEE